MLGGGHSIYDQEPKYGLAVTGLVENDRILRNDTPREGHALILTKPLGTGIVMAAHRVGMASEAALSAALASRAPIHGKRASCHATTGGARA